MPAGRIKAVPPEEFMENFRWLYDRDNPDLTVSFKDMWGTACGEDNCAEYNSPGGWKEAPSFEPELLGKWLVVAASDENGRIARVFQRMWRGQKLVSGSAGRGSHR